MKNPSMKGGDFERRLCHRLSEWWTDDKRNDVFWRTAGSGGRATNRGKKQLTTAGAYGDLTFTDPIGAPLLQFTTIEIKCGYKDFTPGMFFDSKSSWWNTEWWKFIHQAQLSAGLSRTPFWWLIGKRDFKRTVIYFPEGMSNILPSLIPEALNCPSIIVTPPIQGEADPIMGMDFEEFLQSVSPQHILKALNPMIDDADLS